MRLMAEARVASRQIIESTRSQYVFTTRGTSAERRTALTTKAHRTLRLAPGVNTRRPSAFDFRVELLSKKSGWTEHQDGNEKGEADRLLVTRAQHQRRQMLGDPERDP